jgi:hypothetical protein
LEAKLLDEPLCVDEAHATQDSTSASDAIIINQTQYNGQEAPRRRRVLGLSEPVTQQETAALQPFLAQFPAQINRENISKNRV